MIKEIMGLPVHYEVIGTGTPVIVVHGWSLSSRQARLTMEPVFERRQGFSRIYPDMPGHGRTPIADWLTDNDRMLEILLGFIDTVVPGGRFAISGSSWGAYLARGVVQRRGERLDGVMLTVPLIAAPDSERILPPRTVIVRDAALARQLPEDNTAFFDDYVVVQNHRMFKEYKSFTPTPEEKGDVKFQARIREDPAKYAFSFDVDALTEPCQAPTLIVAGRQDAMVGYAQCWPILKNYPRGTLAVLDRAGHMLEFEQERVFRVLAEDWLDRVREYQILRH